MKSPALFISLTVSLTPTTAAPPDGYFELKPGVTLESGDSWQHGGRHFRLFGVQACLRGTFYTDRSGTRRDCGEASLAVLAAYIADTRPVCAQVAQAIGTVFVSCYAPIGTDRLDLANLLISSGFAFASLDERGLPLHTPYAVVEQAAREKKVGLWQFDDVQHPALLLTQRAAGGETSP
ncbi:thermonuclease family protein [Aminobacter sp. MDW-2]|uniref:thermonuclease family protein n=1 Tax=Aminobacter sp. MDW-2 TaxID=2666139 RepID=UPI0012B0EEB2|nr:thermonuclease family protein [Aminobacter sp. MDW-2]MRX36880.1 thermonuclease family protein [Aminobacter sp. MDW-2]QNH37906.1 thermonuclease family protein [Aminobacter sp. MDW-2]